MKPSGKVEKGMVDDPISKWLIGEMQRLGVTKSEVQKKSGLSSHRVNKLLTNAYECPLDDLMSVASCLGYALRVQLDQK